MLSVNSEVVFIVITPEIFIAPAGTKSPSDTSRGRLSPVIADVSIPVAPLVIMPSSGIFSPALTFIVLQEQRESIPFWAARYM